MRLDSNFMYVSQAGLSMVGGAGVAIYSAVIDLLGQGQGTAPLDIIGNTLNGFFGEDAGLTYGGMGGAQLLITTGVAFTTATGATLTIAQQLAPDTGAAGGYLPGAWQTVGQTPAMTAAQLTAAIVIGRMPFLPAFPASLSPRFSRLAFIVPAAADFTAGSIGFAGLTYVRDDQANKYAAANYTVA